MQIRQFNIDKLAKSNGLAKQIASLARSSGISIYALPEAPLPGAFRSLACSLICDAINIEGICEKPSGGHILPVCTLMFSEVCGSLFVQPASMCSLPGCYLKTPAKAVWQTWQAPFFRLAILALKPLRVISFSPQPGQ